jgi:hypothetical protein
MKTPNSIGRKVPSAATLAHRGASFQLAYPPVADRRYLPIRAIRGLNDLIK